MTTAVKPTHSPEDIAAAQALAGRNWNELSEMERHRVIQLQRIHGLLGKSENGHVGPFQEPGHEGA